MRRSLISRYTFDRGYADSRNPLAEGTDTSAEGSFGMLRLGEGYNRPFQGFHSKGAQTGSSVMMPLGDTWGGIKAVGGNASGSIVEDYSGKIYLIGAGTPMRQGIPVQKEVGTFVLSAVSTGSDYFDRGVATGLVAGDAVYFTGAGLTTDLTVNRIYYVSIVTSDRFRVHLTRASALAGTGYVDVTSAGTPATTTVHYGDDITATAALQIASNPLTDTAGLNTFYQDVDSAGISVVDAPLVSVPTTKGATYQGLINGSISFKIAAFRDRENEAADILNINAPVRAIASATSQVVVPNNGTVRVTFPAMPSGGTHWAVFATRVTFGGVGIHSRVGWRAQSTDVDSSDWIYGIPEESITTREVNDGDRNLEFDFKDADLYPEDAWLYDLGPEDGTFFLRMENVGVVLGALDGTVGYVSLPNYMESYNPRHLLYFPEPVTATLQRQMGEYALVACRNSIHALQYVGFQDDDRPSVTMITAVPDVGIKKQSNWTYGGGMAALWVDGAGIATLTMQGDQGVIDYEFGREVAKFTKSWTSDNVKVAFDPKTRSFVFAHQDVSISYCLESGAWADPVYLTDCGFPSTAVWQAVVSAQGELVTSIYDSNGTTYTAYSYDNNSSTTRMPICQIGRWERQESGGRANGIYEIALASTQGGTINTTTPEPIIIGLHSNLFATYLRNCSTSNASTTLTAASAVFTSDWTGKRAVVFGTGVGGVGVNYLSVTLTYLNTTTITMSSPAQATLTGCFVMVGEDFFAETPVTGREQHFYNVYPNLQDARSFCASVYIPCLKGSETIIKGAVHELDVMGTAWQTSESRK